eukprot:Skav208211  [mRNA]  locus=scaffold2026:339069:341006:+ [translate_table: standard]
MVDHHVMELRGHLRTQMTAPEMVQTIDLDGDGAIDQAEWTAAATHGRSWAGEGPILGLLGGPFLKPITEPQAEFVRLARLTSAAEDMGCSTVVGLQPGAATET